MTINIKMKLIVVFSVFLIMLSACENNKDVVNRILINNNSSLEGLSFLVGSFGSDVIFPDTILPIENISIRNFARSTRIGNNADFIRIINELPKDTLSFYFFDPNVIENEGWEKVRDEYLVLRRYDLSEDDLRTLDFTVPFPPSAQMSEMKMYPEFEEILLDSTSP